MTFERQLGTAFGPLEIKVLQALWQRHEPASVRDLMPDLDGTVYTTLMTTMDRLFHKGVLSRYKHGRSFLYTVNLSEVEQASKIARGWFDALVPADDPQSAKVVLSQFVDAVGDRGAALLDELEQLVIQRRSALRARHDGFG
jgi:predicted transcriptional regulator